MPRKKMESFNRVAIRRRDRCLETGEAEEAGEVFKKRWGKPFEFISHNYWKR